MMFTTHVLIGILVAFLYDPSLLVLILIGSTFPDFDVFFEHRKTLHAPNIYFFSSLILLPFNFNGFLFLFMASLHCYIDVMGSASFRPWNSSETDRSVYNHISEKWIENRTLIYDGSKEDFLFSSFILIIILFIVPSFKIIVFSLFVYSVGGFYTILRKKIPEHLGI